MPEYSGTTITPADGVQVPAMNGASGGNFLLSALRNYILASKGQANGLASLDGNGKLPAAQLPDLADDVIVVASYATLPAQGESGKIYITADNNKLYRWDSNVSDYVVLSVDLSAYATKAEVNALSARVSNLEQTTKQDEQTVAYPDDGNYSSIMPNGVPASVAEYGEVATIRGKSRGWNRLIKSSGLVTGTYYDVIFSVTADGELQLSGTCSGDAQIQIVANSVDACVAGHQYLLVGGTANFNIRPYDSLDWDTGSGAIFTAQSSNSLRLAGKLVNGTVYNQKSHIFARDLTLIFPEGVPSTVAECVQKCPDILKADAYNAGSLVDTTVTGVEATSINIFDEETELGAIDITTGAKVAYSGAIRTKNFIPVEAGQTYYLLNKSMTSGYMLACFYDSLGNFVTNSFSGGYWNNTFVVPSGCSNLLFCFSDPYGTTYKHDTQICLNSCADKTTYHPHILDTLMLSSPVPLKEAGAVSEVLDVETGKKTRPVGTADLGDFGWYKDSNGSMDFFESLTGLSDCVSYYGDGYAVPDFTCGMFTPNSQSIFLATPYNICQQVYASGKKILVSAPFGKYADAAAFKTAMTGVKLNYPRATPLSDEQVCDPIPDNFVKVQAGGTINTIQSQTPVIDNCLDVTYDFIPV